MNQKLNVLNSLTEVDRLIAEAIELILKRDDSDLAAFNVTLIELADEFKD